MAKINLASLLKAGIITLSVIFWTYLIVVATLLRPIADEICVLGEMQRGDSFPPFHVSPRVVASLFTWVSSMFWLNSYFVAILMQWLVISILLSISLRALYKTLSIEISKTEALKFGLVLTPFFLLFLPHKNQAAYDAFYWFGGSWHAVGALLAMYVVLSVINQKTKLPTLIALIILASLWSEVTSIVVIVALIVSAIFYKSKRNFLLIIPIFSIILHTYNSRNSGRLVAPTNTDKIFLDMNTIKGLVLMYLIFSVHGIAIAATSSLWMSPNERMKPSKLNQTQLAALSALIVAGIAFFLASALTYATWRSTAIFGFLAFGVGVILWQGFLRKTLFTKVISSALLPLIIISNLGGMLPMIDLLEIRKNWWESNNSTNWSNISKNNLSQKQQTEIPADWGKGEWVDQCFMNLKVAKNDS